MKRATIFTSLSALGALALPLTNLFTPLTARAQSEPLPDLTITQVVQVGSVLRVKTKNSGLSPAGQAKLAIIAEGRLAAVKVVGPLVPGQEQWMDFECGTPPRPRPWTIFADFDNKVRERSETNNAVVY
jgi:subtilase family serine protease